MNGYSGKRGVATSRAPRKGVGSRDANSAQDQNVQFCNRIGCSGRIKYGNQNTNIGSSEKAKSSKSSFCSSNGNGVVEASSKSSSATAREKTSNLDSKRKSSSQSESSQSGDSEATQSTSSLSGSTSKSAQNPVAKTGSVPSSVRSRKKIQHTSVTNKQTTQTASAISPTAKSSGIGALNSSSSNRSKCVKNLHCNSASDAVAPNCSSSGSKSPCKNVMKKRSVEGDSTSSESGRGRQAIAAAHVSSSSSRASVSASRNISSTSGGDSSVSASARAGGPANVSKCHTRLSYRQNGRNTLSFRESSSRASRFPDSEPPRNVGRPRLSQQYSTNASSSGLSSYSLSSSNDDGRSTLMPYASAESGYSHFMNRDTLQRYNMDGIAEVLLALERIEQEEMTHEQILALETSLFLSGLNIYDQHRDMRLDIDDMSYEELLALGDRMGTVSTALSEKELSKCIKRSVYQVTPTKAGFTESGEDGDDIKCSICQEEYVKGDGIGELIECEHVYHVSCINQWLRLKNWCPICKRAAAPSSSSPSSALS